MKSKVIQLYYYNGRPETKEDSLRRFKEGNFKSLIDAVCARIPSL